jgi:2'-5' RNA ligase
MPPSLRLFLAIDPPAETAVQARRIIGRLERFGLDAKWVDPGQLHLTLQFLGSDVDATHLHGLCLAMDQACAATAPFEVECGGVGAFPNAVNPRTIWLGVREGAEDLTRLHGSLAAVLGPLGYPAEDRRFVPHITLGRIRPGRQWHASAEAKALADEMERLVDLSAGRRLVQHVILYASQRDRTGPVYSRMHTAKLRGA